MSAPYDTLYDFETPIEAAVATLLSGLGLTTVVSHDAADYAKTRARVEILFKQDAATRHQSMVPFTFPDGVTRNVARYDAWQGTLTLQVVVSTGAAGAPSHADFALYRSRIRQKLAAWWALNDTDLLPWYKIADCLDAGATPALRSTDGYWFCTLSYHLEFTIRGEAW